MLLKQSNTAITSDADLYSVQKPKTKLVPTSIKRAERRENEQGMEHAKLHIQTKLTVTTLNTWSLGTPHHSCSPRKGVHGQSATAQSPSVDSLTTWYDHCQLLMSWVLQTWLRLVACQLEESSLNQIITWGYAWWTINLNHQLAIDWNDPLKTKLRLCWRKNVGKPKSAERICDHLPLATGRALPRVGWAMDETISSYIPFL